MNAYALQCEYRSNPLGIDVLQPLLSWKCEGEGRQLAYRVTVHDETDKRIWDSGKLSSASMRCRYQGPELLSGQRLFWTVTLWDDTDSCTESEKSWFEMGLLHEEDWKAQWICGEGTDQAERLPADCYRKTFELHGEVRRARLYATACGVYSVELNGVRLPGVLAPGATEYEKHLYYQTYDITQQLRKENKCCVTVGDGWFKGKLGSTNAEYFFGTQLKFLGQIVIDYVDGKREIICSDDSWQWSNDGPILYSDLKDGEIYDARKTPSYSKFAQLTDYTTRPTASPSNGITEHEMLTPTLLISPSGARILDFGQNIAGYIRFIAEGERGQTLRLRMGEALDHGEFSDITLLTGLPDTPSTRQEILYTCDGERHEFQPMFFYSGFRYALVEGVAQIRPEDFTAVAVYSDMDFCGSFRCSNDKINQFVSNTLWSLKSNFVDIPTDCPQREKSGWTGDAQIFIQTASYFTNSAAFYRKWLRDVRDCQREDGRVDNVCPKIRVEAANRDLLNGSSGWADAAVIIPYTLWKLYGDESFIVDNYELMRDWAAYMRKAAADKSFYHLPDGHPIKAMIAPYLLPDSPYAKYMVESGLHWGEWSEPDIDGTKELVFPKQEITTAYLHYSMSLLAEMLHAIGKEEEASLCEEYAEGARAAYNYHFVRNGSIKAPRQAPMVRSLALGLLNDADARSVASQLNKSAIDRDYTVGTGFLSTPYVLQMLVKYGYTETAYRMLENTKAPGWLAMVEQGATTVWEGYTAYDKDGHPLMQSMNHYSPGAVCAFLFDTVCGIRVDRENHFTICPIPGGTLESAEAVYDSPYGRVLSSWSRDKGNYCFQVEIPGNTDADLRLPNGQRYALGPGKYSYRI